MCKYGIVTPTFAPHFCYVDKLLKSAEECIVDKEHVQIILTIERREYLELKKIVEKYELLDIKICIFEELLEKNGIEISPSRILEKYGKYSFQTLKKFYTMLDSELDKFLVLDSESMIINKVNIDVLFQEYFKAPRIIGASVQEIDSSEIKYAVKKSVQNILGKACNYWFLECFEWFYDKKILNDLFSEYGAPIDIIEKDHEEYFNSVGIFEIILYDTYIYHNLVKYNYTLIDTVEILKKYLGNALYEKYIDKYYDLFNGECGLLERAMNILTKENIRCIERMYKDNHFNIIRSDCSLSELKIQQEFIENINPVVLAASQDHFFGINSSKCYMTNYKKNAAKNRRKCVIRDLIHSILYRTSPSYRGASHINSTLIRMENRIIEIEQQLEKQSK